MECYYVCWPWLTSKCIAQVCQNQLSFLFYRLDALPVTQPTVSKYWREKYHIPWTCLPQAHLGVFQLYLWPLTAPGYLGEGCYAFHQSSDASTPQPLDTTTPNKYSINLYSILQPCSRAPVKVLPWYLGALIGTFEPLNKWSQWR